MGTLATSAPVANVDPVARVLGIAGLVLALASFIFAWYQWHHSGASLKVTINAIGSRQRGLDRNDSELWIVTVDVLNTGRMPAVIRDVSVEQMASRLALTTWLWLYLWAKLFGRGNAIGTDAEPVEGELPYVIPPTGYMEAEATLTAGVMDPSCRWLRAGHDLARRWKDSRIASYPHSPRSAVASRAQEDAPSVRLGYG